VADSLFGGDIVRAAAGIRAVVDAQMADLVRKGTIERGHDPRDFVLMAYGGAGPLHAATYGRDIGISQLLIPLNATVYSAFGAAASDIQHTFKVSSPLMLPGDPAVVAEHYRKLEAQARALLHQQDVADGDIRLVRWAEVRYRRQMHEVRVTVTERELDWMALEELTAAFEAKYEAIYGQGTAYREAGMEVVTFGLDAVGLIRKPGLPRERANGTDISAARKGSRPVHWVEVGDFVETAIYAGERLCPSHRLRGPALVEHTGTTVAIPPDDRAEVDEYRNILITFGGNRD
jgi:N-methylhydantoinase A